MNIFFQGMIYALVLWGIFYEWKFLFIYFLILAIYETTAQLLQKKQKNGSRQKIGAFSWNQPSKPNCLISIDCDYQKVDDYIQKFNKQNPNDKISFTIIALKAIGEMMKLGFNKSIKFGNICDLTRKVSVLVSVDDDQGKNLAQITVDDPTIKNYFDIKQQIKGKVGKLKNKKNEDFNEQMRIVKSIPTFLFQVMLNLSTFFSYVLELNFKNLRIKPNNFGSVVLTNTMNFPCEKGYPPHVEVCNTNFLMTLCYPFQKIVIENDKPIIKKMFTVAMTFDQRIGIGEDIIKAVDIAKDVFQNPEKFDKKN